MQSVSLQLTVASCDLNVTDSMYLLGCFTCSYSARLIVEGEVLIAARGDRSDACPLAFLSG